MIKFFKYIWNIRHIVFNTVFSVLVVLLFVHVYDLLHYKYISIEFENLRPVREKIEIYYKGMRIGYVRDMKLCHSCKRTMAKCVLTYKNLLLPENTVAFMKKEKRKDKEYDFIELEYPDKPSNVLISNGSVLNGTATLDVEHFMSNQNGNELEEIKNNLLQSSENLEIVLSTLGDVISTLNEILKQNQKNIYQSTSNFADTTSNLNKLTGKVDNSLKEEYLNETIDNLTSVSNNLKSVTQELSGTGNNLNDSMIPQVQSTLYKTECLMANTNELVCGFKETMKKPFGFFRFIFGTPISSNNVKINKKNCINK